MSSAALLTIWACRLHKASCNSIPIAGEPLHLKISNGDTGTGCKGPIRTLVMRMEHCQGPCAGRAASHQGPRSGGSRWSQIKYRHLVPCITSGQCRPKPPGKPGPKARSAFRKQIIRCRIDEHPSAGSPKQDSCRASCLPSQRGAMAATAAATAAAAAAVMHAGPAAAALHAEPGNALSLPTWAIHISSTVEWGTAMLLFWKYADVTGETCSSNTFHIAHCAPAHGIPSRPTRMPFAICFQVTSAGRG